MKLLLTLALVIAVLATPVSANQEYSAVVQLRAPDAFGGQSYCSGFVINREKQYVLTADHCMPTPFAPEVDGKPAIAEIYHDQELDIAVLSLAYLNPDRPALCPAQRSLVYNEPIVMLGYVLDEFKAIAGKLIFKEIYVADPDAGWMSGPFTQLYPEAIAGMSGGPVVDFEQRVVGMVQQGRGEPAVTFSAPISAIVASVGDRWQCE